MLSPLSCCQPRNEIGIRNSCQFVGIFEVGARRVLVLFSDPTLSMWVQQISGPTMNTVPPKPEVENWRRRPANPVWTPIMWDLPLTLRFYLVHSSEITNCCLSAAIFDWLLPVRSDGMSSESIRFLDPKNVGLAVEITILSSPQAEI
jgi:hypothetical protein